MTAAALAACCAYSAGILGHVAPQSWRPIDAAPVSSAGQAAAGSRTSDLGAPLTGGRMFGVAIAGNALPRWYRGTHVKPQMLMTFQSWGAPLRRDRMPTALLRQDQRVGVHAQMITWQPWTPPPVHSPVSVQDAIQPRFSNAAIAAGLQDSYIRRWASAIGRFPKIRVWIRFGHEMNGDWYPWSHDPAAYVAAWRHIVLIFRLLNVTNARFVWSGNWAVGAPTAAWQQQVMAYWPGRRYVSAIGTTMINFGVAGHTHPVSQFIPHIELMHRLLHEPVMLTEVNTERQGRVAWMLDLARFAARTPWLKAIVLSQLPSFGAAQFATSNLAWNVSEHQSPRVLTAFRTLVESTVG